MEQPPLSLVLMSASFFAVLTKGKAIKYKRNPRIWFWIGFFFGIFGLLAFYATKDRSSKRFLSDKTIPQLPVLSINNGAWYYESENNPVGPVSAEFLKKLFENGEINKNTLVWNENLKDWTKLEEFVK
jgi:GYF domain 2